MNILHPASVILLGLAFLLFASTRSEVLLIALGGGSAILALLIARFHLLRILRRSRWLLLTMLLLFGWMTPGTAMPLLPGATEEGLWLAVENVARLLIAIATVSLLLGVLPPAALVSGMRSLLAPLAGLGGFRDRLAVRLMLTLEAVEAARLGGEDGSATASSLGLPVVPIGPADYAVALCSAGLMLYAVLA
ncbi:MAG: hypothetical protein HZB40_05820 [Rhodocyclales bacterium]|nr:hypothetical protein [Rhodocyclales bacterium]